MPALGNTDRQPAACSTHQGCRAITYRDDIFAVSGDHKACTELRCLHTGRPGKTHSSAPQVVKHPPVHTTCGGTFLVCQHTAVYTTSVRARTARRPAMHIAPYTGNGRKGVIVCAKVLEPPAMATLAPPRARARWRLASGRCPWSECSRRG